MIIKMNENDTDTDEIDIITSEGVKIIIEELDKCSQSNNKLVIWIKKYINIYIIS